MLPRLPRLHYILVRGTKRGVLSVLRQEGLTTGIGALFGVLFLAQVLIFLILGVHARLILLRQQTDVRLEVLQTADDTQIMSLIDSLGKQTYVEEVLYVTREQAYERMQQRDPELISFLEEFAIDNPFPETIGVRLRDLGNYQDLVAFLHRQEYSSTVDPNFLRVTDQEYQVRTVYRAIITARSTLIAVVILLITVLVFVLIELVRRRIVLRREEILVQQLVGATPLAILMPFGVEIFTLLFIALTLSLVSTGIAINFLPFFVPDLTTGGIFGAWVVEMQTLLSMYVPLIVLAEIILLPFLALIGAFFGLLPRLRSHTLSMT